MRVIDGFLNTLNEGKINSNLLKERTERDDALDCAAGAHAGNGELGEPLPNSRERVHFASGNN
ncbi:MAG TPA: hypothetical protein PLQ35_16520 [bacterium]|nr:hypothetical protein [bacterium]